MGLPHGPCPSVTAARRALQLDVPSVAQYEPDELATCHQKSDDFGSLAGTALPKIAIHRSSTSTNMLRKPYTLRRHPFGHTASIASNDELPTANHIIPAAEDDTPTRAARR
jgi:hypothetical protein